MRETREAKKKKKKRAREGKGTGRSKGGGPFVPDPEEKRRICNKTKRQLWQIKKKGVFLWRGTHLLGKKQTEKPVRQPPSGERKKEL